MAYILIVDDEADLAGLVEHHIIQAGHEAETASTGEQALASIRRRLPDLVVLDRMLPDMEGLDVFRALRGDARTHELPVVMLTARAQEDERVRGFEVGVDDYVTKPFSVKELVHRINAVLRRASPKAANTPRRLESGPLALDLGAHRCFVAGDEVPLTTLEFKLLHYLMRQPGRVHSREKLLTDVWGFSVPVGTRTVDTHVMRLRDKLRSAREQIETVRGIGYRLSDDVSQLSQP